MTEPTIEHLCSGGCHACNGAGGYEDHEGAWETCPRCKGVGCSPDCYEQPTTERGATYRVCGGQGRRDIARGVTYDEAVRIRDRFDRDCDRYGLMNPRTLIVREGA